MYSSEGLPPPIQFARPSCGGGGGACLGVHTRLGYRVCLSPCVGDGYALSVLPSLSWWSVLVDVSSPRVCLSMCLGVQGHARGVYYTGTCWRSEF